MGDNITIDTSILQSGRKNLTPKKPPPKQKKDLDLEPLKNLTPNRKRFFMWWFVPFPLKQGKRSWGIYFRKEGHNYPNLLFKTSYLYISPTYPKTNNKNGYSGLWIFMTCLILLMLFEPPKVTSDLRLQQKRKEKLQLLSLLSWGLCCSLQWNELQTSRSLGL